MLRDNRPRLLQLPGFKDARPPPQLDGDVFTVASSIPPKSTQWLWYPYVPAGELTIMAAYGGGSAKGWWRSTSPPESAAGAIGR
jgi:hypothetical protein